MLALILGNLKGGIDMGIEGRIEALEWAATERYNGKFNSLYYDAATAGKSFAYCNRLIDAALAICGHPAHAHRYDGRWSQAATTFLGLFA